jgi:tetratricopeptide (TPR) repeat protein
MEDKLKEIQTNFQLGKYKQSINDLEILINDYANDDLIYKAYDLLGDYLNDLGEHVKAVQAWENSLKILENKTSGIDQLNNQEIVDWINISLQLARSLFQQGITE